MRSSITPERVLVKSGSDVTFECLSYTNSDNLSVQYDWVYPPTIQSSVVVDNQVLKLGNVETEVNITCVVSLLGTDLVSSSAARIIIGKWKNLFM